MRGEGEVVAAATEGSALRRYQDLVVGSRGFGRLLRHEVGAWAARVPGAAGLALRRLLFPGLFERCGRGTVWGHGVVLRHPGRMRIGAGVVVDDGVYLDAKGCAEGEFELGDGAFISRGCILSAKDGTLSIGSGANLGAGCTLYASTRLEIGDDTMLAANCYVGGGRYDPAAARDRPIAEQPLPRQGVVIEEDCWLGAGVIVVDGVRIGRGSIIGAGAVVTRNVPPFTRAAGIPARAIGTRGEDDGAEEG